MNDEDHKIMGDEGAWLLFRKLMHKRYYHLMNEQKEDITKGEVKPLPMAMLRGHIQLRSPEEMLELLEADDIPVNKADLPRERDLDNEDDWTPWAWRLAYHVARRRRDPEHRDSAYLSWWALMRRITYGGLRSEAMTKILEGIDMHQPIVTGFMEAGYHPDEIDLVCRVSVGYKGSSPETSEHDEIKICAFAYDGDVNKIKDCWEFAFRIEGIAKRFEKEIEVLKECKSCCVHKMPIPKGV